MIPHRRIVSVGFRVTGALLGVAALIALIALADAAWTLHRLPADTSSSLDASTYGLAGLLQDLARAIGTFMSAFLAGPGLWFVVFLAVVALLVLLLAVALYFIGRGIDRHARWARFMAVLIGIGLAFASCAIAGILCPELLPIAAVPIALSLYTLWVLIWRFE